jgi:hypothetical protein
MMYTTYMTPPPPTYDHEVRAVIVWAELPSSYLDFIAREMITTAEIYKLVFKAVKWTGPEWLRCNCHTGRHVWYEWSFEGYL